MHPGPLGDRGPSSLDWAIHEGATEWGVTVLQADEEMDGGAVWAPAAVRCPPAGKSDLYRNEVSDAALEAVLLAVERFASGTYPPRRSTDERPDAAITTGRTSTRASAHRLVVGRHRTVLLRKLRAADSQPGVLDALFGAEWFLHGGHPEDELRRQPRRVARHPRRGGLPGDGRRRGVDPGAAPPAPSGRPGHLQAARRHCPRRALAARRCPSARAARVAEGADAPGRTSATGRTGRAGFLSFSFPGGAMSTRSAAGCSTRTGRPAPRPTSVLVLGGDRDFFSNGIHLNVIEAAADPAEESWANINAMDDLVEAVLTTTDRLVVSAVGGNAAAGGVMLALAADEVWCRTGAVLNPHYRLMGLYGSEYWTYTLPRRVGAAAAVRLTQRAMPVTAARRAASAWSTGSSRRRRESSRRRSPASRACSPRPPTFRSASPPRRRPVSTTRRSSRSRTTGRRNWP